MAMGIVIEIVPNVCIYLTRITNTRQLVVYRMIL